MKRTLSVLLMILLVLSLLPAQAFAQDPVVYEKKIEDSVTGTGLFEFNYGGTWGNSSGVTGDSNGDEHWTNKTRWGPTGVLPNFEFKFTGNKISLYGCTQPGLGIGRVLVDGADKGEIDFYSSARLFQQHLITIEGLEEGEHTLYFELTDTKNPASTGYDCVIDYAVVWHAGIEATGISLPASSITLDAGGERQLEPVIEPAAAAEYVALEWNSDNTAVATVDDNGLVKALAEGSATITVTIKGTQLSASLDATVLAASYPFHAVVGSPDRHYMQKDYDAVSDMAQTSWFDTGWKGDRLSSSVVVLSKEGALTNLVAEVSDFDNGSGGVIASPNIKVQSLKETKAYIGRGGSWNNESLKEMVPDIIYGALPIDVAAKRVQPLWVSIDIPQDAKPGVYEGTISLSSDQTDEPTVLNYTFEVLDLVQPDADTHTFNFELWQYPYTTARYYGIAEDDLFGPRHLDLLREQLKAYKAAGGDSISVTIVEDPWNTQTYDPYPAMVKWTKKADGTFAFDYSHFDAYVELAMSVGIDQQIKSFSMVPWENRIIYYDEAQNRNITTKPSPGSAAWKELWGPFLESYVAHLEEKGWFDIAYIAMDERSLNDMRAVINILAEYTNSKGERLKLSGAMNYSALQPEITDQIDDMSVNLEYIDAVGDKLRDFAAARREKGLTTTIYTCVGDYPSSFARSNPSESAWVIWYAESQQVDGFMRWAYDAWVGDPLNDISYRIWESGDPFFVYPGDKTDELPTPRSTPRYERLMEGVRDVKKARYLAAQSPELKESVETLTRSIKRATGKRNAYGAMEAGSQQNRDLIDGEVKRMRDGINEIAKASLATGNKKALYDLYFTVRYYSENRYTPESWAPFAEALEEAATVLAEPSPSQQRIDAALEKLTDAVEGLVKAPIGSVNQVLYTSFDTATIESGYYTDLTGRGNNGELVGGPITVEGILGDAVFFDNGDKAGGDYTVGTQYVNYGQPEDLQFGTEDFSFSFWMKTTNKGTNNAAILSNKDYADGANPGFAVGNFSNDVRMNFNTPGAGRTDINGIPANNNDWHHFVAVFDRANSLLLVYLDGELFGSRSITGHAGNALDTGLDFVLGAGGNKTNALSNCAIDELRVYKAAISDEVVLYLYNTVLYKNQLQTLVAQANALEQDRYTGDSWNNLQNAVRNAEAIISDQNVDEQDILDAHNALQSAIDGLEIIPVDKTALQALYNECLAVENDNYTEDSWGAFQDALTVAEAVLKNESATQQQVDDAKEQLQTAYDGLTKQTEPEVPVESVKINLGALTNLKYGKPLQLDVSINPENATDKSLTFTSSNNNVLTVDANGVVTGVKPGTARVTATAHNGISHTVTIRVTA